MQALTSEIKTFWTDRAQLPVGEIGIEQEIAAGFIDDVQSVDN